MTQLPTPSRLDISGALSTDARYSNPDNKLLQELISSLNHILAITTTPIEGEITKESLHKYLEDVRSEVKVISKDNPAKDYSSTSMQATVKLGIMGEMLIISCKSTEKIITSVSIKVTSSGGQFKTLLGHLLINSE